MARIQLASTQPLNRRVLDVGTQIAGNVAWLALTFGLGVSFTEEISRESPFWALITFSTYGALGLILPIANYHILPRYISYDSELNNFLIKMEDAVRNDLQQAVTFYSQMVSLQTQMHQELMRCTEGGNEIAQSTRWAQCQRTSVNFAARLIPRLRARLQPEFLRVEAESEKDRLQGRDRTIVFDQIFFTDPPSVESGGVAEPVWVVTYRAYRHLPKRPHRPRRTEQVDATESDWGLASPRPAITR